jgi:hypothetical protein
MKPSRKKVPEGSTRIKKVEVQRVTGPNTLTLLHIIYSGLTLGRSIRCGDGRIMCYCSSNWIVVWPLDC